MTKLGGDPHPNALEARQKPEAKRLNKDKAAARERRAEIKRLYEVEKRRVTIIAKRYGISVGRVHQILKEERGG